MQIVYADGFYRTARITGPTHNYLGLAFSDVPVGSVRMIANMAEDGKKRLDADAVLQQVIAAQAFYRKSHGEAVHIAAVEYVPGDTPPAERYFALTLAILNHRRAQPPNP